jgi:ATP-binding cassette subfamily F protein 3
MLHLNDITHSIAGRRLLDGATAHIPAGVKAGLVGRNGTGKTTLLRLIEGKLSPDGGDIRLRPRARMGTVEQEKPGGALILIDFVLRADRERTSLLAEADTATDPHRIADIQTRLADIEAHSAEARAAAILAGLGFSAEDQQRPCGEFSGGWRMRAALAAALFGKPDILLLDEPTNYLDLEGAIWLTRHLSKYPGAALIVSHDRQLLNDACDRILNLQDGKLFMYEGGFDSFERQLAEKQRLDLKMRAKQDAARRHMQEFIDRFKAKASKARQAQSRVKMLEKMEIIATRIERPVAPFHLPFAERKMPSPLIKVENASAGYSEDNPVLRKLDFIIANDDRIAILGRNGSGKSTLVKLLTGQIQPLSGHVGAHKKMQVAYFAQHALDLLRPNETPYEHILALMPDATEAQRRARLGRVGLPGDKAETRAGNLSGGEKTRLLLHLVTFHGAHLLVLDEPTNHLDMDSCEALAEAVNEYEGAVIAISHDWRFLESISDRLWLVENGTAKTYEGDLDEYRKRVLSGGGAPPAASARKKPAPGADDDKAGKRREGAAHRAQIAPLRKEAERLERAIGAQQAEIAQLDRLMATPGLFEKEPAAGADLAQQRARAVRMLEKLEADWFGAAEAYETAREA